MAADVLEHPQGAVLVADHDQRLAKEGKRLRVARLRSIGNEAERRPVTEKDFLLFFLEDGRIGVELVRQPTRRADGLDYGGKVAGVDGHRRHPLQAHSSFSRSNHLQYLYSVHMCPVTKRTVLSQIEHADWVKEPQRQYRIVMLGRIAMPEVSRRGV